MLEGQGIRVVGSKEQAAQMENAVAIEPTKGFLSDHYDPRHKVLRLSEQVYQGRSLSAVGVACHEAGHALQDAKGYAPLTLRSALVPPVAIGSNLAIPLVIGGVILASAIESFQSVGMMLAWGGLIVFSLVVVFQVVTLPVEFDASNRAKLALTNLGITRGREEDRGVAAVLNAAALTYVAALVVALGQLLYLLLIIASARR
jgi:hypothetical protein